MNRITSPGTSILLSLITILGLASPVLSGITFVAGQGILFTSGQAVVLAGADGVLFTAPEAVVLAGADAVVLAGADAVVLAGADALTYTGPEAVVLAGADANSGLRSFDPELAFILNELPDSSAINVIVVFHDIPTDADLNALRTAGILGGTRFRSLPMVMVNATKSQIAAISQLPSVRSIYSNKTFEFFTHDTRAIIGQTKVTTDSTLTRRNAGLPISGSGITVAVLDTGIDATHPDLPFGNQVIQNVRVADLQGTAPFFMYPTVIQGLSDTDLTMGHGTFVAGVIAGNGSASGGYYGGIAPGARLLGISGGDASLIFVLSGFDYILSNRVSQNIRAVNCSFGISGVFDANDPVNIATKILHDAGISVIFSAGNRGDQPNSLNPYSVADWVIGVGSVNKQGSLSSFSSRGAAGYGTFHPTLVAPGENIVSARATGINVVGTAGLAGALVSPENDLTKIPLAYLPRYTLSSGTSFAAPHVAGTIALMLQSNPALTPDEIKTVLQETATPMLDYSRYEVGAGELNTYAAVRRSALGARYGRFRENLTNSASSLSRDPVIRLDGEAGPGLAYTAKFTVPADAVFATILLGWASASAINSPLTVSVSHGSQTYRSSEPVPVAGQRFTKAGITINEPPPGEWTLTVANSAPPTSAPQRFTCAIEIFRADYSVSGLESLSPADRKAAKRALRTGLLVTQSSSFAGASPATRLELARALTLASGANVPQYLPDVSTFADLGDGVETVFVESVVNSPRGNLMGATGSNFYPQATADRLTFAIAAVRATGLESMAVQAGLINPGIADWSAIPLWARGYVSVAVSRGFIKTSSSGYFRPTDSIRRIDLAAGAIAIQEFLR